MPTNTLTDSKCRSAKPTDKPYKLFDGGGLHLFVSPTGSKSWRLSYRLNGKPQTISFGPYPEVSLSEARTRRDASKAALRAGGDPMAERRSSRAPKSSITLLKASQEYWSGRKDLSAGYINNALRGIEMHLVPHFPNWDISSITKADLLAALQPLNAAGKFNYVRKVRMWSGQVFDWAVEHGYAQINPASQIKPEKAFGKKETENFAALEQRDMPEFWRRLSHEGELQSVLACQMLALTWVRTKELRAMKWRDIDRENALWIVQSETMKKRRDHIVPLSRQALILLDKLKARSRGSEFVFPADYTDLKPISENTILYLIYRMGYKGRMTGHGWRSVASTWANERGFNPDAIERQLSHVEKNKTRAAYNRAEYLDERRRMMQDWADWIDSWDVDSSGAED